MTGKEDCCEVSRTARASPNTHVKGIPLPEPEPAVRTRLSGASLMCNAATVDMGVQTVSGIVTVSQAAAQDMTRDTLAPTPNLPRWGDRHRRPHSVGMRRIGFLCT